MINYWVVRPLISGQNVVARLQSGKTCCSNNLASISKRLLFSTKNSFDSSVKFTTTRQNIDNGNKSNLYYLLLGLASGVTAGFVALYTQEMIKDNSVTGEQDADQEEGRRTTPGSSEDDFEKKLSVYRDTFLQYANVVKDGEKYMNFTTFLRSLLPSESEEQKSNTPNTTQVKRHISKRKLKLIFQFADSDGDGLISFSEYVLFLTMLSRPHRQFYVAFKMFDLDEDGAIDREEFKQVILSNRGAKDIKLDFNGGLIDYFFGADGSKKLTFQQFSEFIQKFKDEILRQEFSEYDNDGSGYISIENFVDLLAAHKHLHATGMKKNLDRLRRQGFFKPTGKISFDTFVALNTMSEKLDEIKQAIHVYTAAGNQLDKTDFIRVVKSVVGVNITPREADLVFSLFDSNGDGRLEFQEFLNVMNSRASRKLNIPA